MLMEVNHKENKTLIKGKLLACPRGQSLMSHTSWADKFGKNWNRQKVIRFFKLLESDLMIEQQNEQVTTRVSICNYSQYQDLGKLNRTPKRTGDDTPSEHLSNTEQTGDDTQPNHGNHGNQEIHGKPKPKKDIAPTAKFNFKTALIDLGVENSVVSDWLQVRSKKKATNSETAFKKIKSELDKSPISPNDSITKAVEKSWSGFEAAWLGNQKSELNEFEPTL